MNEPDAFPNISRPVPRLDPSQQVTSGGLSLRDYFAAKAMAALLAAYPSPSSFAGVAADAYEMAKVMLEERAK